MREKQHFQFCTGIVASCYNEAERLQLHEFCGFFKSNDSTIFCFVDDGSTDGTKNILDDSVKKIPNALKLSSSITIKEKQKL